VAGNELLNQGIKLNANQANMVCQFIGEWTFHKSIDLIKSGVPPDCWEPVLQQLAFAVFETAKQSQLNNVSQEDAINLVEQEVNKTYEEAIRGLVDTGKVAGNDLEKVLSHSNLDDLSAEMEQAYAESSTQDEEKLYKTAAMAIVFKRMSQEKVHSILKKLPLNEANQIISFMNMPDLEKQIDPNIVRDMLNDFKKMLPSSKAKDIKVNIQNKLNVMLQKYPKQDILRVLSGEREVVRTMFENPNSLKKEPSSHIINIVYRHISEKLEIKNS